MTTTRGALEAATRAAMSARTEELFRRAGALREGHFLLKSGRHSDRYLEKFQVLQFPDVTSELCAMLAAFGRAGGDPGPADTDAGGRSAQEALAGALRKTWPVGRRVLPDETLVAATILAALPDGWQLAPDPAIRRARAAVDVVAGPTTGGIILAFETARQLGVRGLFAEEIDGETGTRRAFRRGFTIAPGERVLLVDDILTTGGSLSAMLPAVEASGGEIVRAVVLVDRSGGQGALVSPASGRRYPLDALWRLELPSWEAGAGCPGCAADVPLEAPGSGGQRATSPAAPR